MNKTQINSLRDFAIEHSPRAKDVRNQANLLGGEADYYRALAFAAVMVRAKPGTTASEFAASNLLETVCLLYAELEEPISHATRKRLLKRLVNEAKELCAITNHTIPWLTDLPDIQASEPDDDDVARTPTPPATAQLHTRPIAGRLLTTNEAAEALGYKPQTLRKWASEDSGPIRPVQQERGSHLRWSGDEILALMSRK